MNDERPHDTERECWCAPEVEWADPDTGIPYPHGCVVGHHSADCREVSEQVTGESVAPGLGWKIVKVDESLPYARS